MSAAARQRAYRQRRAAGRVKLHIEVDEISLAEKLVATRFLAREQVDDLAEMTAALERLIDQIIAADLRDA